MALTIQEDKTQGQQTLNISGSVVAKLLNGGFLYLKIPILS